MPAIGGVLGIEAKYGTNAVIYGECFDRYPLDPAVASTSTGIPVYAGLVRIL